MDEEAADALLMADALGEFVPTTGGGALGEEEGGAGEEPTPTSTSCQRLLLATGVFAAGVGVGLLIAVVIGDIEQWGLL